MIGFSPDGHFVFAGGPRSDLLRWWDTETGFLVGEVDDVALPMFLDGGKTIALQFRNDSVLHFWDVASGIEIGKWEPMNPVGNNVLEFSACGSDRYLVTEFDSTLGKSNTPSTQLTDKVVDWLSNRLQYDSTSDERRRILIIDAIDHRELGHVPGLSAMISENGRWLATIDANGVVRVWELPLRRPWLKSCRNAALVVFGGWFALALLAKLRRRIGRAGDYVRTEGPQYGDTSATSNM